MSGDTESENAAAKSLLQLVARANANVAELMRLSDYVPTVFAYPDRMYQDILPDFDYFKKADVFEERVSKNEELAERDVACQEDHSEILERFYRLFDSIYRYAQDFCAFIEDVKDGVFIQHTVESILFDPQGKQLMAEAVYLHGVTLTLMDCKIDGQVRERLLVAYYRIKGQHEDNAMDAVCKLCERTGFSVEATKVPAQYPERYFARSELPQDVLEMVIGRLRTDDIYSQMENYPDPAHRSTALATQARMLYVILYFAPHILQQDHTVMREIVDRHFPDNWVVAYNMGFTADLQFAWADYRAARAALANTLQPQLIGRVAERYTRKMTPLHAKLNELLDEGVLNEEYVLDNRLELLEVTRDCNVTLRWLMLHRTCVDPKLNKLITQQLDPEKLLFMLMHTAEFEHKLKELLNTLLNKREERWDSCKEDASGRMSELSEYFSGDKPLTRVEKSADLQDWFSKLSQKIAALDIEDSTASGRRMQQLISALEEVEQYHQIDSSMQIKEFLRETRASLTKMMRIVNVKQTVVETIDEVSDFSYAWDIINDFMHPMQDRIRLTPHTVLTLRATFLKLSSVLRLPLIRIMEANSDDQESVAEYYSTQLVDYIRKVLQVIPETMFEILDQIAVLQTSNLKELPQKIEKDAIAEYAQAEDRYTLAKNTHRISVFTEGILAMDATMLGVIEVKPRQLLEDGIRRELVKKITEALHQYLQFDSSGRGARSELEPRLQRLQKTLDGYRRSFEYIQDYVSLHGLQIWQEEFSRVVNFHVEQECNQFLKKQVNAQTSQYQNKSAPIPMLRASAMGTGPATFMGRLLSELLSVTNPRNTMFLQPSNAWFDLQGNEVLGIRMLALMHSSVQTFGLTGLDRLICFKLTKSLQTWVRSFRKLAQHERTRQRLDRSIEQVSWQLATLRTSHSFANQCFQMQAGDFSGKLFLDTIFNAMWEQRSASEIGSMLGTLFGFVPAHSFKLTTTFWFALQILPSKLEAHSCCVAM